MEAGDRSKILRGYPKIRKGPQPLTDYNGLAGKLLQAHKQKQVITKDLPGYQRDDLDVLRIAAQGWSAALNYDDNDDPAQAIQQACQALRDITYIVCDNAARKAKQQLQLTFEAVDAKGAYAVCDLDPKSNDCELDASCHSIIQDMHVAAITRIKKLSNSCKQKAHKPKNENKSYRNNNNYNSYRGGRGGSFRGRGGSYRGRGGFQKYVSWNDNNDKDKTE